MATPITALVPSPAWTSNPWTGLLLDKTDAFTDHYLSHKCDEHCEIYPVLWSQHAIAYMCWRASADAARERRAS